ncbi:MAG TPA: DoxX family protein [Burkholderiales bacterium]|jgi:putative oxidoreductase|nr:DoxX family protein [Burkholderiales bacterium]
MSSIPATKAAPIIPFFVPLYRYLEPYAYTLIRVAAGAIFIPHGIQKLFLGSAATAALSPMGYALGVLELVGGALLALGVLTRPIALLLLLDVAAIILANMGKGWLWTRGGVQYHVFIFGMLIAVLIGGAGRYAVGKWLKANAGDERLVPIAYAFARVYYALLILPSGYEKVFHDGAARIAAGNVLKTGLQPPVFWAWAVAYLEFYGMILLALGLLTRPIAFAFAIELALIALTIQLPNGYFWTSRGAEFAIMLFVVCLAFVFGGGGRYSVDRRLGREF